MTKHTRHTYVLEFNGLWTQQSLQFKAYFISTYITGSAAEIMLVSVSKACSNNIYTTLSENKKHLLLEYSIFSNLNSYSHTLPGCWFESCCCCPINDIVAPGTDNCDCAGVWMSPTVGRRPLVEGDMVGRRWEGCDWVGGTCARTCACVERGDVSGGTTPVAVGWVLEELPPARRDWARLSRVGSACDKQFKIF